MEKMAQPALSQQQFDKKNSSSHNTKIELWLLNLLRGISAVLIVLYHYTTQYEKSIGHIKRYSFHVPWGCYAIYTFFALSGFLTIYNYDAGRKASDFLKKRIIRLYPVFWVCMAVTTIYMILIMPERAPSVKQFLVNLTMVPSLFGESAVDGVYWTLIIELMFYIGFAVFITMGFVKKNSLYLWIWLLLGFISGIYCFEQTALPFRREIAALLIPDYIYSFLAGCAIFYLNKADRLWEKAGMLAYLLLCVCYCGWRRDSHVVIFFAVMLIILIFFTRETVNTKLRKTRTIFKPLLFISEISYPLYLTHQFIGFGLIQLMEQKGLVSEIWLIIPILHAIVLAGILHFCFEVPFGKKLRHFIR